MTALPAALQARSIDDALLAAWPLPQPDEAADKDGRGRLLIVAGSAGMPGAAVLAATAALRAGAGRLRIATATSIARDVALLMPEARVFALPETAQGGLDPIGVPALAAQAGKVGALLVGPGLQDEAGVFEFVRLLLTRFRGATVILDALAMDVASSRYPFEQPVLLTPHAGEMAHLIGHGRAAVRADPAAAALQGARRWRATVALKGARTVIATPGGELWEHRAEQPGLATSGSGDVLAGLIAGLVARGAPLEQAAAWGVALHARAGARLAERIGPLGFLARELPGEVPALLHEAQAAAQRSAPRRRSLL